MAKYQPYPTMSMPDRTWPDKTIDKAPIWCSVDLRDGNQALATPMNLDQKLMLFKLLVDIGIKEIEVGFPSASQIDFDFCRMLIDQKMIPDDVSIQILTQARKHLIERSFESLKGAKKAILHLYNSTSEQQRRITFNKSRDEIKQMAIDGTQMVIDQLKEVEGTEVQLQYSPESFTGTEMDYALEVCEAVVDTWDPDKRGPVILNLPATVELSTPNVFADRIEWFLKNFSRPDKVIVSLHTHNDRGTGVAATELGLMAGATRVEGTLFGNGERTGNLDLVTTALNMFSQGIDTGLDFSDLPTIRTIFEQCTAMDVHPRHPYAGDLVFTAFSGSHQDAIKKGMAYKNRSSSELWDVPYLPIDPKDIGRTYKAIIRINSQSGKGGVAYILENEYGIKIPKAMQPELGTIINKVSDDLVRELTAEEIFDILKREYIDCGSPLCLGSYAINSNAGDKSVSFTGTVLESGNSVDITGNGNGPIDAFMHAVNSHFSLDLEVAEFEEQAVGSGTETEAAAFIGLQDKGGKITWGIGRDTDTSAAHFTAILNAINRTGKIN
jgi:2-isopropylmalate synthase